MISKTGIGGAAEAAIGGIKKAHQKLERAAADVAHHGARSAEAMRVSFSEEGRRLAAASETSQEQPAGDKRTVPDLAEALVNSNLAKHEHATNIKVLQTVEQVSDALLGVKR